MPELQIAVVAESLPSFRPPLHNQGFARRYQDRVKVRFEAGEDETLGSVLERAVRELAPIPERDEFIEVEDPYSVVYWTWFYEPTDDEGLLGKRYEMAEDLVTVDAHGRAHWNRTKEEIPLGDLIRAADRGLLRGDPLRPYLVLVMPQGEAGSAGGWEALLAGWQLIEHALAARDLAVLLGSVGVGIRRRLRGRKLLAQRHQDLLARGGSAWAVRDTLERRPWTLDDLRIVMNLPSEQAAEEMLELFGFSTGASGEYDLGEDEEARLLRLAEDEVFYTLRMGLENDDERLDRLKTLFRTGNAPPSIEL